MDDKTKQLIADCEQHLQRGQDDERAMMTLAGCTSALIAALRDEDASFKLLNWQFSAVISGVANELVAVGYVDESGGDGIVLAVRHVLKKQAAEIERLRPDAEAWRKGIRILDEMRARIIPCGHTVGDLIGGEGSVTKCGACLASVREHRATLAARLKTALRRFTVNIDQGNTPNGPVEQAIEDIANAMEPRRFFATPANARKVIAAAMASLCTSLKCDVKELCEAASVYFGEDFNKP